MTGLTVDSEIAHAAHALGAVRAEKLQAELNEVPAQLERLQSETRSPAVRREAAALSDRLSASLAQTQTVQQELKDSISRQERIQFVKGFRSHFSCAGSSWVIRYVERVTRKRLRRELRRQCGA